MAGKPGTRRTIGPLAWSNPRLRAAVFQVAALAAVIAVLWYFTATARDNLERQHIASGFAFLGHTAGFSVLQTLIPYSEEASYGRAFLVGLLNTLVVAAAGTITAVLLGFVVGVARLSTNWLVAKLAAVYVETLRNVPLLLQLFFWYFAILRPLPGPRDSVSIFHAIFLNNRGVVLPEVSTAPGAAAFLAALVLGVAAAIFLVRRKGGEHSFRPLYVNIVIIIGLPLLAALVFGAPLTVTPATLGSFDFVGGWRVLPEFAALFLGLSLYTAAFIAEIVRAGIQSVGKGQTEAAHALGLTPGQTLRLVVIPQALRVIVPPLTSQILNLTKNSSLAVAIGYPDLVSVFAGTVLNQTGQAIEVIAITMAVYLVISLATSFAMNLYNARVAIVER